MNWYSYCAGNPVNAVDPNGEMAEVILLKAETDYNAFVVNSSLALLGMAGTAIVARQCIQILLASESEEAQRTADEIISQDRKGGIRGKFPKELLDKTAEQIDKLAKAGDKAAQTARKLLKDGRWKKHGN